MSETPTWLKEWKRWHDGQIWGFIAFRTALYEDQSQWEEYRIRLARLINLPFEIAARDSSMPNDVEIAQAKFDIHWVDDPTLAGANEQMLRAKFKSLEPGLPAGLSRHVFLCASPNAVTSVLSVNESDFPTARSSWWRPGAPFLLAVSTIEDLVPGEGEDEWERFKPVFKVAAETVATGLWWILESGMTDLRKVTVSVKSSNELGDTGWTDRGDLEEEMFWTYGPSPTSLRRRMRLRGFPSPDAM